jgi:CRP-like cAMP-binding protein
LYLGYRDERPWWELVVALRKVAVVSIGTFGTLLGVVDLQAHLALMTIFVSIIVHLIGKPFDVSKANTRLLHNLELAALCICWMTFWGGLLFFLGHEKKNSVSGDVKILTTVCLVVSNVVFLIGSFCVFFREYLRDREKKLQRKSQTQQQDQLTQIVPIAADGSVTDSNDGNEDDNEDDNADVRFIPEEGRRKSVAKSHASFVHDEFHLHEQGLHKKMKKRQEKAKRSTQLRLLARSRLKQSKALRKSTIFQELNDEEIALLIDQMTYKKRFKGDILCKQDDLSDNFYVIVSGKAVVSIHADDDEVDNETEKVADGDGDDDDDETPPVEVDVGQLSALQFFGESALLAASDDEIPHRTATVRVASEKLELLCLHRLNYLKLMQSAAAQNMFQSKRNSVTNVDGGGRGGDGGGEMCSESASVLERLKSIAEQRNSENKLIMKRLKTSVGTRQSSGERSLFS